MAKRAFWLGMCVVLVAALLGVGVKARPFVPLVGAWMYDTIQRPPGAPVEVSTADISDAGPGSLLSAKTMPGVARKWFGRHMEAARVIYRSTNGDDNSPTVVSGSVFIPKGDAPEGGWPVISLGHATLGIDNECAPSLSPELLGFLTYVNVLIEMGYAVALADFQGLGVKGVHPYSDSRTAGLNMIDAVRAMRRTFPNVSDRWVAVGDSQGAGAAWSADEQAGKYAPELKLMGAAAASPGADMVGLVDKAADGTLTKEQRGVMQAVIESLARLHPDLNRDDFRRGAAEHYWNVLSNCSPEGLYRRNAALRDVGAGDFAPRTIAAGNRLREYLSRWALPQLPLTAPLYVFYGGKDPFIDAAWTKSALERACAMGGTITIKYDPNGGHNPTDALHLIRWVVDRFDDEPVENDC